MSNSRNPLQFKILSIIFTLKDCPLKSILSSAATVSRSTSIYMGLKEWWDPTKVQYRKQELAGQSAGAVDVICLPHDHLLLFPAKSALILFKKQVEISRS